MEGSDALVTTLHQRFLGLDRSGGVACVVSGSPGAGKTFLAERFLAGLPQGTARLRGRGLRTGVAPLMPICEAIRTCDAGTNIDRLRSVAEEFAGTIPVVKEALGPLVRARSRTLHARADLREVMPSETYTFVVLARLLESLAGDEAPVLFLDDIQWMDKSSIGFLGYLATQIREKRVFLLLVRRMNGKKDDQVDRLLETLRHEAGERSVELVVQPLARAEQLSLMRTVLGRVELKDADLEWFDASSQGKPYYLRELIQLLRDDGRLAQVNGTWTLQKSSEGPVIPPSLQSYLRERILGATRDDPFARDAIQFAACAGTTFDVRVIADALGEKPRRVGAILEAVQASTGLVRRIGDTTIFSFEHDLTRDSLLADLGDFATEIHATLASTLANREKIDPAVVAYQFDAAGDSAAAANWYLRASDSASKNSFFDSALDYARLADVASAEVGNDPSLATRVCIALGGALLGSERYADAVTTLESRVDEFTPESAAPIRHLIGRAAARVPDDSSHQRAVRELRSAVATFTDEGNDAMLAAANSDLVHAYDAIGDHAASRAAFRSAVAAAKRAGDTAALVRLMRLTCIFWQPEKVVETLERAVKDARRHRLFYEEALCENNLGSARFALHDLERARTHYERAAAALKRLGGYRRDAPLNNIALVHIAEGDLVGARRLLEEAVGSSLDPHSLLFIRSNQGVVQGLEGEHAASVGHLERAVRDADRTGDLFYRDCLRYNLARAYLELGMPDEAYVAATACPPHHSSSDDLLVIAKRARLLISIAEAKGASVPDALKNDALVLDRTTKAQAWLYREPWYFCDIEFWED